MQFDTHQTDLYVLTESRTEDDRVRAFLKDSGVGFTCCRSDVVGQPWYGKAFLDIPFRSDLRAEIEKLAD